MKKNNERLIQFFDVELFGKSTARDISNNLASPRTIDEILREMVTLKGLGIAKQDYDVRRGFELVLADIEERSDYWVLLINIVDPNADHIVTQKVGGTDADRELIQFDENKGLESSAHLIIFKQPNAASKHLFLFERIDALHFTRVLKFLNFLFKFASKQFKTSYTEPHPNGASNSFHRIYCCINFLAHPSGAFINELDTGIIKGITITSGLDKLVGFDANTHTTLTGLQIKARVSKTDIIRAGSNYRYLRKVLRDANDVGSPYVRVSFTDHTGSGHTAELDASTGHLVDSDKYIKKCKIEGFGGGLRTAYPNIQTLIVDKMRALVP